MTDYPNQEALNKALNIYRTCMRSFILHHLKKIRGMKVEDSVIESLEDANQFERVDKIRDILCQANRNIESAIDINDFPHLVHQNWTNIFKEPISDDKTFRNQLWLIVECRNADWAHPPEGDAEFESTRAHLFLITDVLEKIKRPDKQSDVKIIRDDLFTDDTAERLAEAEERLKDLETENAEYKKFRAEVKKHLKTAKSEKSRYEEDNATLAKQIDEKEKRVKKLSTQLKSARTENDKYKKNLAGTKRRLEKSEVAQTGSKERLETISKELKVTKEEARTFEENLKTTSDQLKEAVDEWIASIESLTATRKLFTAATIGSQEIQKIFPSFETDSAVRILDRRGTDKRTYLLGLLEQKQPTIVYVQSEEKIDQLLTLVGPEKATVIGKRNAQTSAAEDAEILEKLRTGELVAFVSDTTFSTSIPSHCVEHFVFCHLAPSSDAFFERCQPAFTSEKDTYLHLIYNSEQDVKGLVQKYPDRKMLERLYPELRKRAETNGNFVKTEDLYSELGIAKLSIETGLAIFQELQLLERNGESIKLLPSTGKKLDESEIYRRGEKLKKETADFGDFQFEHSIEQIWEKMLEKLNVDSKRILPESNIHKMPLRISETEGDYLKNSQTQPEQSTEVVEIDNAASDETAAHHTPKPSRANAKVTEEQVPPGEIPKKKKPSIAERYVAETTVEDRDGIAAKVVELRINATGSKPLAWKKIREKLGLKENQFHKVIRHSEGYRRAVIQRIKSLKAQEGGWEYNGKLEVLTGIELTEKELA